MSITIYTPNFDDAKELQSYKREISLCLVRYGGLSEAEARQKVATDHLFEVKNETQLMLIFHEYPYYWAMMMLYGQNNPLWYQDPKLWPPPDDYEEWLRSQAADSE